MWQQINNFLTYLANHPLSDLSFWSTWDGIQLFKYLSQIISSDEAKKNLGACKVKSCSIVTHALA